MKTAKEMFEELGYEVMNLSGIVCVRKVLERRFEREFKFWKNERQFQMRGFITIDEFKAITQQMKELGWIE